MDNHFKHISADEKLKAETLKKAKRINWPVIYSVAAILVVVMGVSFFIPRVNDSNNAPEKSLYSDTLKGESYNSTEDFLVEEDVFTGEAAEDIGDGSIYYTSDGSEKEEKPVSATSAPMATETLDEDSETVPAPTMKPIDDDLTKPLTASRLNDNLDFDDWLKVRENFKGYDYGISATNRYKVTVKDNEDKAVKNAKVTLFQEGKEIAKAVTDNKGVAYLFCNLHNEGQKPDKVTVELKGKIVEEVWDDQTETTIKADFEKNAVYDLDIMFMIDTTGSMGDELNYLKYQTNSMLQSLPTQLNTNISVNFYRDYEDEYVVKSNPFTSSLKEVSSFFNQTNANGGGDTPEAVEKALEDGILKHSWRENSIKLMFLVLDAPAHEKTDEALQQYISKASETGIRIIPVMASGADSVCEIMLRQMALITGGQFVFLTDDSGIGGTHLKPDTDEEYEVKPLITVLKEIINEYTY